MIEHVARADAAAAFSSIHRLLRPGGALLLSTPQPGSPLELAGRVAFLPGILQLVRLLYREPVLPTGHVNLMSARQVRRRLSEAGFRVMRSWRSGCYIPLVAELMGERGLSLERRLEPRLGGGRLAGLLWTQYYLAERP
jgi:SAM-dependent methyltransferase